MKINNKLIHVSQYFPGKGKINKAFTLVELIVVITILAILGTIAFISLQGYSRDARDSTRMADISSIETQLELFSVKSGTLPIPENNIELISSGVTIGYQGYSDKQTLNILKVNNGGLDPIDQTAYTYRINASKRAYQIMGFLENGNQTAYNFLSQVNAAANLTNRFPLSKGKVLGILLEQTTNTPLQDIKTGIVNLRTDTTLVSTYLTNTIIKKGQIKDIYGTLENLASSQKFDKPQIKCAVGYIPVPGNMDFGQPAFCVAKYEMSYLNENLPNDFTFVNGTGWNTVFYSGSKIPVSIPLSYPIADITQQQAIDSCKAIGSGYHLITNNEWMTIARNIEKQSINWSSGITGSGYIYNGVSNSTLGCNGTTNSIYTSLTRTSATKTGPGFGNISCDNKRKLTLSNGEQIWDLIGNVLEHVNKANTIDGIGYATGINPSLGVNNTWNEWNNIPSLNRLLYGPLLSLDSTKGVGKLLQLTGTEFIRGGSTGYGLNNGLFMLMLNWTANDFNRYIGFRCAR